MLSFQLIGLVIAVYIVVRQFQERSVTLTSLLISPLLVVFYTYFSVIEELTRPIVSVTELLVLMSIGLVVGGLVGAYRGNLAIISFNPERRRVTVKATTANIVLYMIILVFRIASEVLLVLHMNERLAILALIIAFLTTFFLTNIVFERVNWYIRGQHYRANLRRRYANPG